jgi:nitroreductase
MTALDDSVDLLAVVEDLARRRRSNLRVDPDRAVPGELVDRLLRLASTAPNHKRTFPWRFRVVTGDARTSLGEALAADLAETGEPDARLDKSRGKYRRAPVTVVVAARAGDHEVMTAENRDAVSAAIQTLLLGATAAGLASLWSTGAAARSPRVARLCDLDDTDTVVGLVYLGWPIADPAVADRPDPEIVRVEAGPRAP